MTTMTTEKETAKAAAKYYVTAMFHLYPTKSPRAEPFQQAEVIYASLSIEEYDRIVGKTSPGMERIVDEKTNRTFIVDLRECRAIHCGPLRTYP